MLQAKRKILFLEDVMVFPVQAALLPDVLEMTDALELSVLILTPL